MTGTGTSSEKNVPEQVRAREIARRKINRAKARAQKLGYWPRSSGSTKPVPMREGAGSGLSVVSGVLQDLISELGGTQELQVTRVLNDWEEIVGRSVAEHCKPVEITDQKLVVQTESTAWMSNLRLMTPQILGNIAQHIGAGLITELHVRGPSGPSFKRGLRSVPGRGPRDTWG